MTFTVGGVDVTDVHVGATAAEAVYLGADKVWPSAPGLWPPEYAGGSADFVNDSNSYTFGPYTFTASHALVAVVYRSLGSTSISQVMVGGTTGMVLDTYRNALSGNTTRIEWHLVPASGALSIGVTLSATVLRAGVAAWSTGPLTAVADGAQLTKSLTSPVATSGSFVASCMYAAQSIPANYVLTPDQVSHLHEVGDGTQTIAIASQAVADPPDVTFTVDESVGTSGAISNLVCHRP